MNMARNTSAPAGLPSLDIDSASHLRAMQDDLADRVQGAEGVCMPFEAWMHQALYAPGLGHEAAGSTRFGSEAPEGDFATGPEVTPLFGPGLAGQVAQILAASGSKNVL